ncbi:hypothetical protein [Mitsuokella sp.]
MTQRYIGDAMFIQRPQPLAERTEELKELEELDRKREAEAKNAAKSEE